MTDFPVFPSLQVPRADRTLLAILNSVRDSGLAATPTTLALSQARDASVYLERFRAIRAQTEALCAQLSTEDAQAQSMPDASPAKWHLAHTTWFFDTFVLSRLDPGFQAPDPTYATLFNSYYHSVGAQHPRPQRGLITRPSLSEVKAYRALVDAAINNAAHARPGDWESALPVLELGLHHEQQHQELILTDIKHLLSMNPARPAYRTDLEASATPSSPLTWRRVAGGQYEVGAPDTGFAFDNERPRHAVLIDDFEIASRPVTTLEFAQFVADGGYRTPTLWLSDGWDAVRRNDWRHPLYWYQRDGAWHEFTLGGGRPVDPEAPVCHISYYEADAYARWADARLPRETEWEVAYCDAPVTGNFVEQDRLHPGGTTTGSGPATRVFGDVWEWTQSPYSAYPGYQPPPGAIGEYNGKFMCNQIVLRGGSCVTPAGHIRPSYRNFFPPEARWQFSGVRLARD